jgi:hypothetical protein
VAEQTTSSEQVRHLLDEFLTAAPAVARSVVADTTRAVIEGLRRPTVSREWLTSPAGIAVIGGGLGLFGFGWLVGRRARLSRRTALHLVAAGSAGLAAGLLIRSQLAQTPQGTATGPAFSEGEDVGG